MAELSSPLPVRRKLRLSGEVLATYCRVRWWLWRHELEGVVERLRRPSSPASTDDGRSSDADTTHLSGLRLGRAVSRTLRLLPTDSRCLVRSLVLTGLLARRGVASTLVIGVRPAPEFAAHAWVEHTGSALLDPGEGGFERLVEIRVEP
jgi:Transglutaminase-like superfamily